MIELLFGALAFLALLGWGVTNAITSRNHLREANALETIMKVRKLMDDDASAVLERYRELSAARRMTDNGKTQTVLDEDTEARREALRQGLSMTAGMPEMPEGPPLGPEPIEE